MQRYHRNLFQPNFTRKANLRVAETDKKQVDDFEKKYSKISLNLFQSSIDSVTPPILVG